MRYDAKSEIYSTGLEILVQIRRSNRGVAGIRAWMDSRFSVLAACHYPGVSSDRLDSYQRLCFFSVYGRVRHCRGRQALPSRIQMVSSRQHHHSCARLSGREDQCVRVRADRLLGGDSSFPGKKMHVVGSY